MLLRTVLSKNDLVSMLRRSTAEWNAYRRSDPRPVDMTGIDLSGVDLAGADFSDADLQRADLSESDLTKANFTGANLTGADLSWSDLRESSYVYATMSRSQYAVFEKAQRDTVKFVD